MALVEKNHLVAEAFDLGHVVGNVEDRQREMIAQLFNERENLRLRPAVQRRKRLIHQQDLRLRQQGAANADALTLASREIARRTVQKRTDSQEVDDFVEVDRGSVMLLLRSAEEQILSHGEVGKEARLLKHVAERPLMRRNESSAAVLPDLARDIAEPILDVDQSGDAAQNRGLAAAGRAEQHRDSGRRNLENGLERELAERAAKLGADLVRQRHA